MTENNWKLVDAFFDKYDLVDHHIKSYNDFVNNRILFFAVVKNIEIVGEASYMLTPEYKQSHPSVPWLVIEKMRHVLVHGYYMVSAEKVWETVQEDLPILKKQIEALLFEQ